MSIFTIFDRFFIKDEKEKRYQKGEYFGKRTAKDKADAARLHIPTEYKVKQECAKGNARHLLCDLCDRVFINSTNGSEISVEAGA